MRDEITTFLNLELDQTAVSFRVLESEAVDDYLRQRIVYQAADGDDVPAYLFSPADQGSYPAVVAHHQHNSERFLGKSEVAGLAGDPLMAFGPALARRGFVVLAPDSICFEERRRFGTGMEPHEKDDMQHYIEMGERLTMGDTLMRKVLADASGAVSLLINRPDVDSERIGVLGHSYGGNTVLFQMALDPRIAYGVCSGALCSYAYKREHDIPLELALVIPGFAERWDLHHLLDCIAPRSILIVSADEDFYALDAVEVIGRAQNSDHISHFREGGQHALTPKRFQKIMSFLEEQV